MTLNYTSGGDELWVGRPPNTHPSGRHNKPRQILGAAIVDAICEEGNRHCYLTDRKFTGTELQKWSEHVSGYVWAHGDYFVHNAGPTSEIYVYKDTWPIFEQSMIATQNLVGRKSVGFTPSQHSREITKWLRILQPVREDLKKIILPYYEFVACHPQTHHHAYYFDIRSAYWYMVENAPSPRIIFNPRLPKSIGWKPLKENEHDRWKMMIEVMRQHKLTRNAIVGNWTQGYNRDKMKYNRFQNGKIKPYNCLRPYSRLSTFGWYICRLVYELCQEEYLVDNGMYANVDSIITTNHEPTYWKKMGVHYRPKYEGPLDLHSRLVYAIGPHATKQYETIFAPRPLPPGCIRRSVRFNHCETIPHLLPRSDYIHPSVLPYWRPQEKPYKSPQLPPHNLRLRLGDIPAPNIKPDQPPIEELP